MLVKLSRLSYLTDYEILHTHSHEYTKEDRNITRDRNITFRLTISTLMQVKLRVKPSSI